MTYDIHPAAHLFPMIEGEAFDALVADIKANGLLEPIEYQGNTVLDGRNRLRACKAAGVIPEYREIPAHVDAVKYIISRNMHRRHLTVQQRAAIAAELATMEPGNPTGANQHGGGKVSNDTVPDISLDQAAELMGVSRASVARAKKRMKDDPASHESVKRGEKPKKQKEGAGMRTYQTIRKVALTEYAELTGQVMAGGWVDENIKPLILDKLQWTSGFNWAKEISEDRAEEIRRIVRDYVSSKADATDRKTPATSAPTFAMVDAAKSEAETIKQEIEAPEKTKLERAIKAYEKLLDLKFEQRVKDHVDDIIKLYAEEYDRYKAFNDAYSGVFSDDEYRLLISVLHPDRCPPDRATQFAKAFHLIKSKEEILCKVKPTDRPATMPRTLEELLSRRKH